MKLDHFSVSDSVSDRELTTIIMLGFEDGGNRTAGSFAGA